MQAGFGVEVLTGETQVIPYCVFQPYFLLAMTFSLYIFMELNT